MKTKLLLLALAAAFCGQAAAADKTWTGGYVGAHLGSVQGDSRSRVALLDDWANEDQDFQDAVSNEWNTSLSPDGNAFGVQAGYDYQFGNDWVWGISVSYSDVNADDSRLTGQIPNAVSPSVTYSYGNAIDLKSMWGVRTRVGYAFDRSLVYVSAGWASGDVEAGASILSGSNGYSKLGTAKKTLDGTSYGIGWEYAFHDHWSLQLDYQRVDLGKFSYDTAYVAGSTFGPPAYQYSERFTQDLDMNTFSVGVNYRF